MDKREVYRNLVDLLEKEWDKRKPGGTPKLARVGQNRKGVYQGYPFRVAGFPCLGIMPEDSDNALTGSQGAEDIETTFQIFIYAFDFRKEKSAGLLMDMDWTVDEIIKKNRTIRGLVDRTRIGRTQYGEFFRETARGSAIVALAARKEIHVKDFAKR